MEQLRGRRGCRWLWIGERELRAKRMRVRAHDTGYWLPFLPDAYFEVTYPNGDVQACLVEIDMGTLTMAYFGGTSSVTISQSWCSRNQGDAPRRCATWPAASSLATATATITCLRSTKPWRRRRLWARPGGI